MVTLQVGTGDMNDVCYSVCQRLLDSCKEVRRGGGGGGEGGGRAGPMGAREGGSGRGSGLGAGGQLAGGSGRSEDDGKWTRSSSSRLPIANCRHTASGNR